jgi:hypothetical protein
MQTLITLVLEQLQGRVWHTTNADRFQKILASGAILAEPEMPDSDRWSTSQGSRWYPYVRAIGGVSLFDFRHFDSVRYSNVYPASSWREFIPYRNEWKEAVWIEIDFVKLGDLFISGVDLLNRWNRDKVGNRIMPEIEAAHLGRLPSTAFKRAFRVCEGSSLLDFMSLSDKG